jgi:hypothetical protein
VSDDTAESLRAERDHLLGLVKLMENCVDENVRVVDENKRMRAAFRDVVAHIKEGTAFLMSACEWCGETWPKCDDQPREVTEQVAREHLYTCAKHPLRIECEALRAEVRRLQQIIVDET